MKNNELNEKTRKKDKRWKKGGSNRVNKIKGERK